jgi:hypothetical protein
MRNKGQEFHNPYDQDKKDNHMHISYNKFLSKKEGHICIYSVLWD